MGVMVAPTLTSPGHWINGERVEGRGEFLEVKSIQR